MKKAIGRFIAFLKVLLSAWSLSSRLERLSARAAQADLFEKQLREIQTRADSLQRKLDVIEHDNSVAREIERIPPETRKSLPPSSLPPTSTELAKEIQHLHSELNLTRRDLTAAQNQAVDTHEQLALAMRKNTNLETKLRAANAKLTGKDKVAVVEQDDVIKRLEEDLSKTRRSLADANRQLASTTAKMVEAMNRNTKLEIDAREIAADGLVAKAHEISKSTSMLVITTKNMSIVNHASFANLTNRIQNICKHLDAIVLLCDDAKIESLSPEEAAEQHNVVAIPWEDDWNSKREQVLDKVAKLFDEYARDPDAFNSPNVYRRTKKETA